MESARKPKNERQRIEALESLNILDTLPEREFDQITFLASQICNTPIALISLVDENRQWFKSKVGLDATETHRDLAFCAHALLEEDVFVIPDSSKDKRFSDNPLATGAPHVQFYAGAPLKSPDGFTIGTLCVIDSKPRLLEPDKITVLKILSEQITKLIELRTQVVILKKSEEKLQFKNKALETIIEGVVLQDSTGSIIDFNPAATAVLGLTENQLLGKTSMDPDWHAIKEDGTDFPGKEHPAMICLQTGKPQKNVIMGIRNSKIEVRWIKINSMPLFQFSNKSPSHSVTSFADITELRKHENEQQRLHSQLAESAKLSALGEMAAGIAHEINNPLAIIRGKSSLLIRKLSEYKIDTASSLKDLQIIENTVDRIAKIIRALNLYSRNSQKDEYEIANLTDIIADAIELCRERFTIAKIEIRLNCAPDLKVCCLPSQISQVFINLLNNSFDAVSSLENKWIEITGHKKDGIIVLNFTDSGLGINTSVVSKIMDPFFSTKDTGKGKGLGLSISKASIESFGGTLSYNKNFVNTTFTITLPAVNQTTKAKSA